MLRALIFGFLNRATGALYPSYDAIQRRTGFCRSSIAHALARLERCGLLTITRRLCRQYVTRTSFIPALPDFVRDLGRSDRQAQRMLPSN